MAFGEARIATASFHTQARALKKAADLGQLSVLDSLREEEEDAEAEKIAEEKRRLRTAPPPSTRVRVFDRDECEALRDAPVTKGKGSLLEAAGAPRLIKIDSGRVFWETRAKSTGFVAKCTAHNEYEEEYAAMRANPRLMEAMRVPASGRHRRDPPELASRAGAWKRGPTSPSFLDIRIPANGNI